MLRMRSIFVVVACLFVFANPRITRAEQAPLPPDLIALDSDEGQRIFAHAPAKADYWRLAESYVEQQDQSFCPVASSVMALNALRLPAPEVKAWAPYRRFTQDNLFNERARALGVARGGLQLEQIAQLLEANGAAARVRYASELAPADLRRALAANLADPSDYVIVNYLRPAIGQEPTAPIVNQIAGHFSPLAAYDDESDRFLILDVARYKYPPVWVPAVRLFEAMRAVDVDSGKARGFVVASVGPGLAAAEVRATGSRLLWIAGAIFVVVFTLGAVVGSVVTRRRMRRAHAARAV
jgi:hypothetical protein